MGWSASSHRGRQADTDADKHARSAVPQMPADARSVRSVGSSEKSDPPALTRAILRFATILLDAVPCGLADDQLSSSLNAEELRRLRKQQTTCRYLIALFSMDSLCWGCYKAIEYEALQSARIANALDPTGFPFR